MDKTIKDMPEVFLTESLVAIDQLIKCYRDGKGLSECPLCKVHCKMCGRYGTPNQGCYCLWYFFTESTCIHQEIDSNTTINDVRRRPSLYKDFSAKRLKQLYSWKSRVVKEINRRKREERWS